MPHTSLSLCMIVRDEAEMLPECLRSTGGVADEIIVVDTGSTDETPRVAREFGARVIPVGTTAVRTLETHAATGKTAGDAELFITPGYGFRSVDALITNFHQPRSTPILLASAFAGRERLLSAYAEAVREGYRLFSYGDSMLIL